MNGQHAAKPEPVTGEVYWRVADMARKRGWISRTGRTPGKPNLLAIMRATGLSYQTVYMLLRKPAKVRRVDVATLERLCAVFECEPGELLGINWRYSPHPRAHTAKLNPLSAENRLPWPEPFYRRCVAGQYDGPDESSMAFASDASDDDELDEGGEAAWRLPAYDQKPSHGSGLGIEW
jgi:DNA-binding Xre family transcriptional regulator